MIVVPLSFELGKIVGVEPMTQTNVWDHPVLYIGSSYSGLLEEVREWLEANTTAPWKFGFNSRTYELRFESEQDAIAFKLRWLHGKV